MTHTEQLEREAELTRGHLSASLDELRGRLSPGQIVEQLVDYVQDGSGGEFFHNFKRQIAANPLPVTLIGAGVAWLVMSGRRSANGNGRHSDGYRPSHVPSVAGTARGSVATPTADISHATTHSAAADLGDAVQSGADSARQMKESTIDAARRMKDSTVDSAHEMKDMVYNAATGAYEQVTGAYEQLGEQASRTASRVTDSIRTLGRGTAATGQSLAEFCREQPLVVAGIGVALGAALGAALPATEVENRVMGDASDEAKRKVREIAEETIDKTRAVGERAVDAGLEEAEAQGLTAMQTEGDVRSGAQVDAEADSRAGTQVNTDTDNQADEGGTQERFTQTSLGEPDDSPTVPAKEARQMG